MRGESSAAVLAAGLTLSYGATAVLKGVDLSVARGEVVALLGPSGCGKTTLLRLVAGLLTPSGGSVSIDGKLVSDAASGRHVPPEQRRLGMVFQDYALWPHMSVAENVAFPLEMRGVRGGEVKSRVAAALERVGLGTYGARSPGQLSGGQQQRVAIARAIVAEPDIVLFDEPLSNLDRELREAMIGELSELVEALGFTALYVTHDQSEAFTLANRVAVMRAGEIVQFASPEDLVAAPADRGVAEFLRLGAIARISRRDNQWWLDEAGLPLAEIATAGAPADAAEVLLPRNGMRLTDPAGAALTGTVVRSQFRGTSHLIDVKLGNGLLLGLEHQSRLAPGEKVGVAIDSSRLRWFPTSPTTQTGDL